MIFGNRTLRIHFLRGAAGFAAIYLALRVFGASGWPALVLAVVALWMLKGCPMCWTVGLFETLAQVAFRADETKP